MTLWDIDQDDFEENFEDNVCAFWAKCTEIMAARYVQSVTNDRLNNRYKTLGIHLMASKTHFYDDVFDDLYCLTNFKNELDVNKAPEDKE